MSKRQLKDIRDQIEVELSALRKEVESYSARPFDQRERANRAERARRLLHAAVESGDRAQHSAASALLHAAIDSAYPPGFWDDWDRLKRGESTGVEQAVRFLEADPIFFRTGYIKAELIQFLKRIDLTPRHADRLRGVVLRIVDTRDGREFRRYCRLARKVNNAELRAALMQRLENDDANVRRRARWVLEALNT